jgi:hypothetical protein
MTIPVGNPAPGGHPAAGQRTREACLDRAHRSEAAATTLSRATYVWPGAARVAPSGCIGFQEPQYRAASTTPPLIE